MSIGLPSLLILTGCNPPMPDSLKIELAEREVQCGDTFADAKFSSEIVDIAAFWNSSMSEACGGSMGLNITEDFPAGNGIVVSEGEVIGCAPYATVPLAADAAVFSFFFTDIYEINLSPSVIEGVVSGEINNWSDVAIQELNPNLTTPNLPITLVSEAPAGAISAMKIWLSSALGKDVSLSGLVPSTGPEVDALYEMVDGDLKLTSFSALQLAGVSYANMVMDSASPDTSTVLPNVQTIQTAITQTVVSGEAPFLTFTYDPSIPPAPLPGQFEALLPWGAVFPLEMNLCGQDDLQVRFVARFLLRLDAQGSISNGVFSPLKQEIRQKAVAVVAKGLPEVTIPEELEQELQQ
jgi:hypothetical protein